MILFQNDWNRYPDAIIDYKTTNQSFLRLAAIYAEMGVANNAFHLSLLQPHLQGVDPFDPNLDNETKVAIALECRWNPWYCLREIIRLPPQGGPNPIRYKANRGNISLSWAFFNHIDYALIQPRQTGKSGSADSIWVIVLFLMGSHSAIQLLTKDDKLRKENIDRLKGIRDQLPDYLNPTGNGDTDNKEMITCKARHNVYKTAVGRSDKAAADRIGRGLTSPIIHTDETPYISNIQISLPVALSSGTAARANAMAAGGLYCNVFTTTAGKKDTENGKYAYNLIHDGMYWNEKILDSKDIEDAKETILRNSTAKQPMINGTFSHRQLGKSDQWLADVLANSRATGDLADRDYFNIWTSGTESSPLSILLNETIHNSIEEPSYVEMTKDKYMIRWYIPQSQISKQLNSTWHVLCLDSSNAIGKDANGITLIDVRNMNIIAAANLSEANLYRFAKWITDFLVLYPKVIFVIENKSSAQGIIDTLLTTLPMFGIDPFKRIYNRLVENYERYPEQYINIQKPLHNRQEHIYLKNKSLFGFMTNGNSRAYLYDNVLQQAAKSTGHLIKDKVLSEEIRSLITKNGRVDHPSGGHDDVCFVGDTLVRTITGNKPIKELGIGDLVLTRKGYKPIVKLFCRKSVVITKYGITGTPTHPFITPIGEVHFKDLKPESLVYVWNEKLLTTEIKTITDILNQKEHNTEITFTDTTNGKSLLLHYIDRFMRMFMDQSRQEKLSITKTEIFSTMILKISNVLHTLNMLVGIQHQKSFVEKEQLMVGKKINLEYGGQITQSLQPNRLLKMAQNLKELVIGEKKTQTSQDKSTQKPVKRALRQKERKEIVYNIMVDDCHEYFVNDILVHNCVSWLLGHYFVAHSKNISFYGIDPGLCLSMVTEDGATASEEDLIKAGERKRLRLEIDKLRQELSTAKTTTDKFRLEHILKIKTKETENDGGEVISMEAVIKDATDHRTKNKSMREMLSRFNRVN